MQKINYLAIVPARKNSKRIKNKNLVKINNKELVKFTIEAAKKVKKINKIVVTSDDKRI
jgi:CMP-N-acetylneuraminic acid synthetase